MLDLCHRGGFERLLVRTPFATLGHYEWNPTFAPDGDQSVRRMVRAAEEAGVTLGVLVQEEVISLNDSYFAPKYFGQYKRSQPLRLFDAIAAEDVDIALRRDASFEGLAAMNLIQIDEEMLSIGTLEYAGDVVLLHHCKRGIHGTKKAAHSIDAMAYRIWDVPDRFVIPDGELLQAVRQNLADRLAAVNITFVLQKGDAGQETLDEAIHVRNVERWEEQGVANNTLGWFVVHAADKKRLASSMEELEWMLSKSVAFDASYGMVIEPKAMDDHGALSEMLESMRQWNMLCRQGAFSASQRQTMKDPYLHWHLERQTDSLFLLYPWNFSRRYNCVLQEVDTGLLQSEAWTWNVEEEGRYGLRIQVDGEVDVVNPMVNTSKGLVMFPCTLKPGQRLFYHFGETALVVDANLNIVEEVEIEGLPELALGQNEVSLLCEVDPALQVKPIVTLRYIIREQPFVIHPYK